MAALSTWALRVEAGTDCKPLSDKQIANWQRWGALRDPAEGKWSSVDVERIRQIQELGNEVRSVPRRAVRLFDPTYPTPPGKLRDAMIDVVKKTSARGRKMRRVETALRLLSEDDASKPIRKRSRSGSWRIPPDQWEQTLGGFNDEDFRQIAGYSASQARSLLKYLFISKSDILTGTPIEEIIVILTVRQLAIGTEIQARSSAP